MGRAHWRGADSLAEKVLSSSLSTVYSGGEGAQGPKVGLVSAAWFLSVSPRVLSLLPSLPSDLLLQSLLGGGGNANS